jgi:Pyruvate/2-oxoacid:ferredoxin oxidoreductase gamma subunit
VTERALILVGVGGEGIQLAATIVAHAAVRNGLYVSLLGLYGGEMRGGPSECSISFSTGPVEAPLILSETWSAIVLGPTFWSSTQRKLRPDSFVLFDRDKSTGEHAGGTYKALPLAATRIARECGDERLASLVMIGAYGELTGIAPAVTLASAMESLVPSYRSERIASNRRALVAGAEAVASVPRLAELRMGAP